MTRKPITLAKTAGASHTEPQAGFLNTAELLRLVPISRRTLCDRIAEGAIPTIRLGRRNLFDWDSVRAALLRRQRAE